MQIPSRMKHNAEPPKTRRIMPIATLKPRSLGIPFWNGVFLRVVAELVADVVPMKKVGVMEAALDVGTFLVVLTR